MRQELPKLNTPASVETRLNREAWHRPLVSIIVTHFNYSSHVGDALLSILDQTHEKWECVIVDDASQPDHKERLDKIVSSLGSDRIKVIWLDENVGQLMAFFAGLEATRGEFVCALDPDDRYAKSFLAESLSAHLNQTVVCPMVCTDQYTLVNGEVTTASQARHRFRQLGHRSKVLRIDSEDTYLLYFPPTRTGWHWTSTSAFMFRRAALNYLRPHKKPAYKICADTYLALGAHLLGGGIFLTKPLIYRSLHETNSFIVNNIYSSFQPKHRTTGSGDSEQYRLDVLEALRLNNAPIQASGKKRGTWARWRDSLAKRWPRRI